MNHAIDNALDRTAARMEREFETITPFRWNYYAMLLVIMMICSGFSVHVYSKINAETDSLRATSSPAVQCINQLTSLVAKFRH